MKKLLLLLPLLLCSCATQERWKSPIQWCIWEIEQYEGYEEGFAYTYKDVYPLDYKIESKHSLDAFIITTYTDELRAEWFCFLEYKSSPLTTSVRRDHVIAIDCDVIWEINYEECEFPIGENTDLIDYVDKSVRTQFKLDYQESDYISSFTKIDDSYYNPKFVTEVYHRPHYQTDIYKIEYLSAFNDKQELIIQKVK